MENTFEELIEEGLSKIDDFDDVPVLMKKLMKKVREATTEEFCDALLDVSLPAETVKKIGQIIKSKDAIKTK